MPRAALAISAVGTAGSRHPGDPFAERIAGLDEAGLIDLLALRPDLAVPPPSSLQEVTRRANGTKSVQRVTERLDRFSLQGVQALQLAGSDHSMARLLALLGPEAPEAAVEHVLEQLERHVLVSRQGGELLLHPLLAGMTTPCLPVSPPARQMSKNPSIFSLAPPIAWMIPCWSTEPVTAKHCRIGTSDKADSSANSSAAEALSPSTPP